MGTNHAGRHRPADRAPASGAATRARHCGHSGRLPAKVIRRPLLSAGAALVLVGACAAGYAKAGDAASGSAPTLAAPAAAISQTHERGTEQLGRTAYQLEATALTHVRRSAAADASGAQEAAAVARIAAEQAAGAARIAAERDAAQAQASRDAQREAVVDRAQQDPRSAARMMLGDFGWGESQWSCLERLWVGESGWDYRATNRSSGAYGIPQAPPAAKMGSVADDYLTNPVTQITWGLQYIRDSYGTPCGALSFWNAKSPHWY